MNRSALHRSRQILDSRRGSIHLKSPAYFLCRQSFTGRMRWRVRSHNFHRVTAVRQQAGVERIGLVSQIVLQQKPARFAVATVVNRIQELIVILIVRAPFHSNRVAIVGAGHRGFKV